MYIQNSACSRPHRAAVNSMKAIAANPRFVSINSAIEIDLTGQVVADSIGTAIYSGVGGQPDFVRAAQASFDGRGISVIALPSTTSKGHSRIVPTLQPGAGALQVLSQFISNRRINISSLINFLPSRRRDAAFRRRVGGYRVWSVQSKGKESETARQMFDSNCSSRLPRHARGRGAQAIPLSLKFANSE